MLFAQTRVEAACAARVSIRAWRKSFVCLHVKLSWSAALALTALATVALRVLVMPIAPHDFWWHLAQGREIWASGAVPTVDAFSWTRDGQAFFNQSWLSQVWFYALHQLGGVSLILVAQTVCVVAAYAMMLHVTAKRAGSMTVAAGLLLVFAVPMSLDNWQVRPQSFALPFFAATLWILTAYRERWFNALWAMPPLMLVWANLHGSFEQGLALMAMAMVGPAIEIAAGRLKPVVRRRGQNTECSASGVCDGRHPAQRAFLPRFQSLAFWSALSFLATLLNPRGFNLYFYVHDVLRHPSTRFSGEWLAPTLTEFTGAWFWGSVAALGLLVAWKRPRLPLTDWLWLLVFLLVAMKSGRSMMWFAMLAMPILGAMLRSVRAPQPQSRVAPTKTPNAMNVVLVSVAWLPALCALPWLKPDLGLPPQIGSLLDDSTPVGAARFLQRLPASQRPRRLWHNEGAGSYFAWTRQRVWIDTRFELYPPQQWRDHIAFKNGQRVRELARKHRFDCALVNRRERALQRQLLALGWKSAYRDANWTLLRR